MNTKRSLSTSLISLVLCFAMLLGTTFAWFTDSVTSSGNKIQAGTLKLDLHVLKEGDNNEWYSIKNESAPLFTYENWEPGYTDVTILKVENKGNLALKWVAKFFSENALSELAKVIDVYVLPGATAYPTDRSNLEAEGWTKTGTLDAFINSISTTTYGYLDGGESATLGIALQMQESAGNEYQNMTLGEFDIRIVATQLNSEDDSFGPDYDIDSEYPADPLYFSQGTEIADSVILHGALNSDVTISNDSSDVNAILPEGVKLAEGVKNVKLTVKSADANGNLSLGDGETALNFDVHIDGIAADNQQPMIVNLGAILEAGLTETELRLFHVENGVPVSMTRVYSNFNANNQYTYNEATGELSIYVKSFSVFSAVNGAADVWDGEAVAEDFASGTGTEADPFIIETAAQLVYFRNKVDAGITYAGQFVKLNKDIDLNKKLFDPIGFGYTYNKDRDTAFMGTFDGGHHTIYNLYQNGWDLDPNPGVYDTYTYSTAGGGLFASIENATIKNLAVSGADIVFECVDIGIVVGYAQGNCHFENIVVTNSKIANYNRATGAVVGEVCYGSYGTDVNNGYSHTFENITVDSSVVVSSLWGSFDTLIGGVIGGKWGDATVKMTNVSTAAELDVYSDVTAAYQWYAYRRCGMLIGHTEQNSPKKALNAAADFLTCENVNVYYGDWVNYTYYEFADQDSDTGRRYPWVRAEASPVGNNGAFSNPRYGVPTHNGVKVTEDPNMESRKTDYTPIVFNQLYGGGQGVYGTNDHEGKGVTIHYSLNKTIYIDNNLGWDNLTLDYWFANGDDRWSTLVDGTGMEPIKDGSTVYKVTLPAYAAGFEITGTDKNGLTVSTPEIALSQAVEKSTYPLNAFQLSLKVDGDNELLVNAGNILYNVEITGTNAAKYDVVIYDKAYAGTFATNAYGVAFVIDSNGKIVKIYNAANGDKSVVYYDANGSETIIAAGDESANKTYATVAWNNLADGERLIIFPNDGVNNTVRNWARDLSATSVGKKLTLTASISDSMNIYVDVNINGFNNTHEVTDNNYLYNTLVNREKNPYSAHYKVIVYDKSYDYANYPFSTNEYGIAIVLDADNRVVKIYDAANGTGEVYYYDANTTKSELNIANGDYATRAWSELKDGEKLVIFPNHKTDNSSRDWAKQLCNNWNNGISGANVIINASQKIPSTIYFQNTQKWTNVGIQYWYEDGTSYTGVLGATTLNDGLYDVYRVVLPAGVVKVAFGPASGSDDKATVTISTPEITSIVDGHIYIVDGQTVNSCIYKSGYKTVKFENEWAWSNIKIYYWFANGKDTWSTFTWDERPAMTSNTYKVPAYAAGYVISGQYSTYTFQTADKVVSDLSTVTYYPNDCVIINGDKDGHANKYTIFFRDDWNWKDNTRIHYWGGSSSTTWPGASMTLVGKHKGYNVYRIEVPNGTTGIVFNNNNQGSQTNNITTNIRDGVYLTIVWDGVDNSNRGNGTVLR